MNTTRRSVVAAAAVMIVGLHALPAAAQPTKDDQKCLSAVSSAVQQFTQKKLKAFAKCRAVASPAEATCPDEKASGAITKARDKMVSKIGKKCGEKFDAGRALGYTGCTTAGCTSAADYNACVTCTTEAVTDRLAGDTGACGRIDEECGPPGALAPQCPETEFCSTTCECTPHPVCGNGIVETGLGSDEQCDPPGSTGGCGAGEVCNSRCECSTPCDCCALDPTQLQTTVVRGSGRCGQLRNFRCEAPDSNAAEAGDFTSHACPPGDACNFGPCVPGQNFCAGDFQIACADDADCDGRCTEIQAGSLPQDLDCGVLWTGGGSNAVPLPLLIPDTSTVLTKVTSCESDGTITLGPVTQAEAGSNLTCTEGRKCSSGSDNPGAPCVLGADCPNGTCEDRCLFGAPLPVPNANSIPTSVCVVNVVEQDAHGTGTCDGNSEVVAPLRSNVFLTGDILSAFVGPINVPGVQPCALCSAQCVGGTNASQPCQDDGDCPGSTCDGTPNCIGGPSHGNTCTPQTSGPDVLNEAFPTSHDCPPDPSTTITAAIGGLPIDFSLTTDAVTMVSVDRPRQRRVFCGFCRDVDVEGQLCFEGDRTSICPDSATNPDCRPLSGVTSGCGNATPCSDDSDCVPPYESCQQRNSGAFSKAAATIFDIGGSPSECLADGQAHQAKVVSAFCVPPTFDPTVDAAGDLPGPGAVSIQVDAQLVP